MEEIMIFPYYNILDMGNNKSITIINTQKNEIKLTLGQKTCAWCGFLSTEPF